MRACVVPLIAAMARAAEVSLVWRIPTRDPFRIEPIVAAVNDTLTFTWSSPHNVFLSTSEAAFDACDKSSGVELAAGVSGGTYARTLSAPGTQYFICTVGGHCASGQKVKVHVLDDGVTRPSPPPAPALPAQPALPSLPACAADRPGGETHRTLYVPAPLSDAASESLVASWTAKLCCVYTWAVACSQPGCTPYLVTYDGSRRSYAATSFEGAATAAFDDICGMSMGSRDCASQADCIAQAEALLLHNDSNSLAPPSSSPNAAVSSKRGTCTTAVVAAMSALMLVARRTTVVEKRARV